MSSPLPHPLRRLAILIFPWFALRRLRFLIEQPDHPEGDEWNRGYQRALYEVALNLGLDP